MEAAKRFHRPGSLMTERPRRRCRLHMIAKGEAGSRRFAVVERLADALEVDLAELFSNEILSGAIIRHGART